MEFLNGQHLIWLWGLLPLGLLVIWLSRRSYKNYSAMGAPQKFSSSSGYWLRNYLLSQITFLMALALLVLAIADPLGAISTSKEKSDGSRVNLFFVVDVSRSMLAQDIPPQRLQRSKEIISNIVATLPKSSFALIAFKDEATTMLPLTKDLTQLEKVLQNLSPAVLAAGGSSIGSGLQQAITIANQLDHPRSAILLFSDGGGDNNSYYLANQALSSWAGQFYIIGSGSLTGSTIEIDDKKIRDQLGNLVVSRLEQAALKKLARFNRGYYYSINDNNLLAEITNRIGSLNQNNSSVYGRKRIYRWLIIAALLLLLLSWICKNSSLPQEKSR